MARQKQTPLRREHSSEYTSSADRNGTPTKLSRNLDNNGIVATPIKANGHANGKAAAAAPSAAPQKKQAGLLELIIGVVGIYASLYAPLPPRLQDLTS